MSTERIGIFGGTFDPPHLGHLILASEAQAQLELTRLLWVLTPLPPHKLDYLITPLAHRLKMLRLAIQGDPCFELSRVEIDRSGPHYSVDTVQLIRDEHPKAEIIYLMGGDSLHNLATWHHPADIVSACHEIGVMRRPGDSIDLTALEAALPGITSKIRFVDTPLLEISSREIRRRAAAGLPIRYYLPPDVYAYIQESRIYRQ
ncbi:MAG: nicotinate (nicotinamide) nucleotide adenylyltransferase [Chloroflexi bacterium]|nr:nicotinate (nicotinamide) nucleotide adenylyltransferase [Chloroflexota bacterium]